MLLYLTLFNFKGSRTVCGEPDLRVVSVAPVYECCQLLTTRTRGLWMHLQKSENGSEVKR